MVIIKDIRTFKSLSAEPGEELAMGGEGAPDIPELPDTGEEQTAPDAGEKTSKEPAADDIGVQPPVEDSLDSSVSDVSPKVKGILMLAVLIHDKGANVTKKDLLSSIVNASADSKELRSMFFGMVFLGTNLNFYSKFLAEIGDVGNDVDWDVEKLKKTLSEW